MPGSKACSLGTAWDSWSGSAAHLCTPSPKLPTQEDLEGPGWSLGPRQDQGSLEEWGVGEEEGGRVSVTLRDYLFHPLLPLPHLVFADGQRQ